MAKQYIELPPTYAPPDDKTEWDATVRIEREEDGRHCIKTIDGVEFEDDEGNEMEVETEEVTTAPKTMAEAAKMHRDGGYMM